MSAMYFMHLKLQCSRYMCIHQQKIIVWRHPSCHLCKYFTTMRKMVLDFDYSPLSCSYLCCVLGYCCTVLYRKSFRCDQSDTHTRTHKEDSITLIYTWERNRERLSFTVQCFALLCCDVLCSLHRFFTTDALFCSSFLYCSQFQRESYIAHCSLLLSVFYLFSFWVSKPIYSEQYCNQKNEDDESTDSTPFNSFSILFAESEGEALSLSASNYFTYLVSSLLFKTKRFGHE